MNTNRQLLGDNFTATRTQLGGVAWINQYDTPASTCRLARRDLYELIPRSVTNALVHAAVVAVHHVGNIQIFKGDQLVHVDQLARFLVRKVVAAIGDSLVNMIERPFATVKLWRALRLFRQATLHSCECIFVLAEKTGIVDLAAIAHSCEVSQANVDSGYLVCGHQRIGFNDTGETRVPVTDSITLNGQSLTLPSHGTVQLDFDITDLGQAHTAIVEQSPVALCLGIRERIVTVNRFESWVSWFFLAGFHTAKERTKSQIDTLLCVLHGLRMTVTQELMFLSPLRQQFIRGVTRDGLLPFFPACFSGFKRLVVNPSATIQDVLERFPLGLTWEKPVLVRQSHVGMIP